MFHRRRSMCNGEYYFEKLQQREENRGDGVGYCYVSPETRSYMTTASGAALLPGEFDWKRVEERIATAYFNFPLYNPTSEEVTPDRDKSRYDRFFEMAIKSKLFVELEKYRRVYESLGISFKPNDRNQLHRELKDVYGELTANDTTFGKTVTADTDFGKTVTADTDFGKTVTADTDFGKIVTAVNTPTGHESIKTVSDSGTAGTGESVSSGDLTKQTNANTAFDSGSFADVDKATTSVITPSRTVTTETRDAGTKTTTDTSTDSGDETTTTTEGGDETTTTTEGGDETTTTTEGGTEGVTGSKNYTLNHTEDVTGWQFYDVESSVSANLEIAKTTIANMIVKDIVSVIVNAVYNSKPSRPNIPDFIMEKILWGEYDETVDWEELKGTWKGVSYREIYD